MTIHESNHIQLFGSGPNSWKNPLISFKKKHTCDFKNLDFILFIFIQRQQISRLLPILWLHRHPLQSLSFFLYLHNLRTITQWLLSYFQEHVYFYILKVFFKKIILIIFASNYFLYIFLDYFLILKINLKKSSHLPPSQILNIQVYCQTSFWVVII